MKEDIAAPKIPSWGNNKIFKITLAMDAINNENAIKSVRNLDVNIVEIILCRPKKINPLATKGITIAPGKNSTVEKIKIKD